MHNHWSSQPDAEYPYIWTNIDMNIRPPSNSNIWDPADIRISASPVFRISAGIQISPVSGYQSLSKHSHIRIYLYICIPWQ